jgi:sulfate adenylyltransferase subunit 2
MVARQMNHLDKLEAQSIYIFREAFNKISKLAMFWSFGKDSTIMIHLARKAFDGNVPFPLIHCDTELEMPEVYKYRDKYVKEWKIDLITQICPGIETTDPTLPEAARLGARKTGGIKQVMAKYKFDGLVAGIRRDEEGTRAKERYFSPRDVENQWNVKDQPPEFWGQYTTDFPPGTHVRIHPLLHWTELDVWEYIKREDIPMVPLYFAKPYHEFEGRNYGGKMMRFRSLGERGITWPLESDAANIDDIIAELKVTRVSERSGRPMGVDEDEAAFEKLRADGYM